MQVCACMCTQFAFGVFPTDESCVLWRLHICNVQGIACTFRHVFCCPHSDKQTLVLLKSDLHHTYTLYTLKDFEGLSAAGIQYFGAVLYSIPDGPGLQMSPTLSLALQSWTPQPLCMQSSNLSAFLQSTLSNRMRAVECCDHKIITEQ